MAVTLLLLLLITSVLISIFLFATLKKEIWSLERRLNMAATKVELSDIRSRLHSVSVPKELQGPVELYYRGQKATVQATFLPKVYK